MSTFTWGGARKGAGRKRVEKPANVPHRPRLDFEQPSPVHVTFKMARGVCNLRAQAPFKAVTRSIRRAAKRFKTRIIHFAVLTNHIHLIIESDDRVSLSRAMKGLGVRIARGLNRVMDRQGVVIARRHHTRVMFMLGHARRTMRYVRENYRKHCGHDTTTSVSTDRRSSWGIELGLPAPQTGLLLLVDGFDY